MKAEEVLIRCSALGLIMTEPRSKSEVLSETCKDYLRELFIQIKYGRKKEFTNKYTEKGTAVEEDSITLYSRFKKDYFVNNKARLSNEFITGEWDILKNEVVTDIKSSWDIFTFHKESETLNKKYFYQGQGYMALTGAKQCVIAYCLVNTPDRLIDQEKTRAAYKFSGDDLIKANEEIDRLCIYDDIPISERVVEVKFDRDDKVIESIYEKVKQCREYLKIVKGL